MPSTVSSIDKSEWRPVPGYEGLFEVSDDGRVRSITRVIKSGLGKRTLKGRELKPSTHAKGYKLVSLRANNKRRSTAIHILVAEAFLGPRPDDSWVVTHIDGNPTNNRPDNLMWVTRAVSKFLTRDKSKEQRLTA